MLCVSALIGIQTLYPDLERRTDAWNDTLRRAGKTWRVKKIGDLEIYPDQTHGFRFIGTRGKVVVADKEIGTVQWGNYIRGKNKGQSKYGFDLVSWWNSIQSGKRMPLDQVQRIIESRLPTEQPALEVRVEDVKDHCEPEERKWLEGQRPMLVTHTYRCQQPVPPGGSIVKPDKS